MLQVLQILNTNVRVIRIMPNTPMTVGAGACLFTPDTLANQNDCFVVKKMLSGTSLCTQVSEAMMDSLGALVGCGPAYVS